jgi:hypothetical protein
MGLATGLPRTGCIFRTRRQTNQEFHMKLIRRTALGLTLVSAWLSAPTAAYAQQTCSIPNAQGTAVSYTCSASYTPATPNWLASFKTWVAANATTGAMACFAPGTYTLPSTPETAVRTVDTDRMVLRNVQNMKLCAPSGGAIFEHQSVNSSGTPLTTTVEMPSFHIASSSNVSVKGMEFRNLTQYAGVGNPSNRHTQAFLAEDAINTRFFDSKFSGLGKSTVVAAGSSTLSLSNATVNCAYFCLAALQLSSTVKRSFTVSNSQFTLNDTLNAIDDHAAIYTESADFTISGSTFNYITGQGFVAGIGSTTDQINLSNVSITGTNAQGRSRMAGWVALNPNYSNLHINYTGSTPYTQYGRAYYCVTFSNPACETGFEKTEAYGSWFKTRPNASSSYTTVPLPPARTDRLLIVNGGGQDTLWIQGAIVLNSAVMQYPVAQQWSTLPAAALGGFLDPGDRMVAGDFLAPGQQRVLFFNAEPLGGAISVRQLGGTGANGTLTTELFMDWTPAMAANLGGWIDASDRLLAGDFWGLGRSQLLFMNVDGAGGAFYLAAVDGVNNQLQSLAVVPWSAALSTSLAGWMDAGDKLVAGDFTGSGRAQLLFINTTGGSPGAASLRQFDNTTNAFQVISTVAWNKVVGTNTAIWQQASAKVLSGDFLGLNRDQLMFMNPSNTGVALSIWAFDSATGRFNEVYKFNYGASEVPVGSFNGSFEANDGQFGF